MGFKQRIWLFAAICGLVTISDSLMSYSVPVILYNFYKNAFLAGLILSISSMAGVLIDFFTAEKLENKNYKFFVKMMILFAFLFPFIYILPFKGTPVFIISMLVWSIYYEARDFSKYHFVNKTVKSNMHTWAWSIIVTLHTIGLILGPTISVFASDINENLKYIIALSCIVTGGFLFLLLTKTSKEHMHTNENYINARSEKIEFKILFTLVKRVWPLMIFTFVIILIDVAFWTIGVYLSEELRMTNKLGGFLLPLWGLGGIYSGFIANKIYLKFGKKRTAFVLGIVSGGVLSCMSFVKDVYQILGIVFILSSIHGVVFVLLSATFEDFVARLNSNKNDVITLSQISINLGYIIGPIILGALADKYSVHYTFGLLGILVASVSTAVIFVTPRKIKLPQMELKYENNLE